MIQLPVIKIVRTTPPNLFGGAAVEGRLTVQPVASGVWDEFLQLQISPATRRSYAAGLRDFFRREFQAEVSPETIFAFLQLPEREAIGHVIAYQGHLLEAQLSAGTVNARLAALKSFVTHAYKGKGRIDKEPIDLAPATVEAISDWLASMGESISPALFVSSRDTRISVDRLYQIVGGLAAAAGIDRVVSPHKIRHSSITALLDLNGGDVRLAQAHSRHKNLATLIRYDDGRQQLQGKAAKTLADAISERDVDFYG
jgi:site-specific recombinase XerD